MTTMPSSRSSTPGALALALRPGFFPAHVAPPAKTQKIFLEVKAGTVKDFAGGWLAALYFRCIPECGTRKAVTTSQNRLWKKALSAHHESSGHRPRTPARRSAGLDQGPAARAALQPASVDRRLQHAPRLISKRFPGALRVLFSPQHGFFAEKQDNMIESDNMTDPVLNLPVFSLYGQTRVPSPEMFADIDVLLVDLQDAGTRVYTFVYTVSYCMETARNCGKRVLVLDRPNPVGGEAVEGNLLQPECASFVGRFPIPMRHA